MCLWKSYLRCKLLRDYEILSEFNFPFFKFYFNQCHCHSLFITGVSKGQLLISFHVLVGLRHYQQRYEQDSCYSPMTKRNLTGRGKNEITAGRLSPESHNTVAFGLSARGFFV